MGTTCYDCCQTAANLTKLIVWSDVKGDIAGKNDTFKLGEVELLTPEPLHQVTPQAGDPLTSVCPCEVPPGSPVSATPIEMALRSILVFKLLPRCWVDREAKGRRLLLNHLLARDVRQMADVVLINPHPFFLNREKAPKREYFTADGYHIHRILGVRKMSKLIKVHVKKKLGAQWIGVRHCLELPQIYSCSHCTLVQPLQDKRPQVVVVPELHPPPITMPASHRLPANDTILAVPDLPNRMTGEGL
ncbi:hypothetical protein HPB47_003904 [Ixodes persulcatus]|uniref:Uncharacterized protein n=1 Tax=Ixodes persulcatus TaxID=34615 RepID=A0AC60PI66_IXOPE|nr:hypothetical protein HPB47_003904 [Ixodes persulcatus]